MLAQGGAGAAVKEVVEAAADSPDGGDDGLVYVRCRVQLTANVGPEAVGDAAVDVAAAAEASRLAGLLSDRLAGFVFPTGVLVLNGAVDEEAEPEPVISASSGSTTLGSILEAVERAEARTAAGGAGGAGGASSSKKAKSKGKGKGGKGKGGKGKGKGGKGKGKGGKGGGTSARPRGAGAFGDADCPGARVTELRDGHTVVCAEWTSCATVGAGPGMRAVLAAYEAPSPTVSLPVTCDVLVVADASDTLDGVAASLRAALEQQARRLVSRLYEAAREVADGGVGSSPLSAAAFHFQPPQGPAGAESAPVPHPVTAMYSGRADGSDDAAPYSVAQRVAVHRRLGLAASRPLFRRGNALSFALPAAVPDAHLDVRGVPLLANVHVGIAPPKLEGASIHLVQGDYLYYHYMQQGMDDKGWGCAYRSLQTLLSWYRLNNYTSAPVATHREIQEALVIVDSFSKKPSFVGSKQWIGSMEVGYVLDHLLGVKYKVLSVNRGAELPTTARELAAHFDTVGTPVMMGGGALAYTCLGVAYNSRTGEARFLILDPHYTGADDLDTIQKKAVSLEGYRAIPVGWRGAEAFAQNDFYNLCLPQRPDLV